MLGLEIPYQSKSSDGRLPLPSFPSPAIEEKKRAGLFTKERLENEIDRIHEAIATGTLALDYSRRKGLK